ncbi:hypothetical protein [Sphingomonas paeninsulae]|uniref:hypothetical protein n=1 Tax=Sphingomonas paeninsulae TaxID=2319844 RepID=UPI0013CEBCC9|nr:hypothetical protein [Sphingomonas paeninsulae]
MARTDGSGNITTPDMRNLVVMGAGALAAAGTLFGAGLSTSTSTTAGGHTHTNASSLAGSATDNTSITIEQMPNHSHNTTWTPGYTPANIDSSGVNEVTQYGSGLSFATTAVGGGQGHSHSLGGTAHTHGISTVGDHQHQVQLPVYQPAMALHFIMQV